MYIRSLVLYGLCVLVMCITARSALVSTLSVGGSGGWGAYLPGTSAVGSGDEFVRLSVATAVMDEQFK